MIRLLPPVAIPGPKLPPLAVKLPVPPIVSVALAIDMPEPPPADKVFVPVIVSVTFAPLLSANGFVRLVLRLIVTPLSVTLATALFATIILLLFVDPETAIFAPLLTVKTLVPPFQEHWFVASLPLDHVPVLRLNVPVGCPYKVPVKTAIAAQTNFEKSITLIFNSPLL
jgi:hypothetical protein